MVWGFDLTFSLSGSVFTSDSLQGKFEDGDTGYRMWAGRGLNKTLGVLTVRTKDSPVE